MKISEATRKALSKYPYLDRYITLKLINYRALARLILPDIKKDLGSSPNIQSVVTALRRESNTRKRPEKTRLEPILSESTVNLKYDMAALTLSLGVGEIEKTKKKLLEEGTYIVLQGLENLTIVADENSVKKVKERLKSEMQEFYGGLAIVVVKSPPEITRTPGVIAYLANILALESINVIEMMSSHAETAFIVEEKDSLKAIEVLRREIKRSRSSL